MSFKFPFTNYHELNLTWVLDQLKKLFEESAENVTTIENYNGRLTAVETELPLVSETAQDASQNAAVAATLAQTAKSTADTAQENAIQAQAAAGQARQEAQGAQTAADAATQAAQQAQATAQNFDGRITQAENDASQALEASRSFENRVQSAITTANNANQTATNAQGIAMRADQNAGAALDKIGDLSQLTTTAKNNLVVAINEAAQSGGVTSVNGKTGAVVLDASDIGYNDTTVETALDGKQNAPTAAGTAGQVLGLNDSLQPVWVDQTGGDSSNCAPVIINTASGAIASFTDGANNLPVEKLVVNIEPQQSGLSGVDIYNDSAYGGLINWNQRAPELNSVNWTVNETYGSGVWTDGKVIYTITTKNTSQSIFRGTGLGGIPMIQGHKYFITLDALCSESSNAVRLYVMNNQLTSEKSVAANAKTKVSWIIQSTQPTGGNSFFGIYPNLGSGLSVGETFEVSNVMVFDITQMFGSTVADYIYNLEQTTAGDGVAWFRNLFPKNYYSYNIGEETTVSAVNENEYNKISVTFPNEAVAVYGGTLTLNPDRTGTLVVNSEPSHTYQLTAEQISGIMTTLLGANNIWSNVGSVSVNYPADTKLYIDNKIAELQALILEH